LHWLQGAPQQVEFSVEYARDALDAGRTLQRSLMTHTRTELRGSAPLVAVQVGGWVGEPQCSALKDDLKARRIKQGTVQQEVQGQRARQLGTLEPLRTVFWAWCMCTSRGSRTGRLQGLSCYSCEGARLLEARFACF
jgi:hypothetical protein